MKKLRVWTLATLWFASVSALSTYGVIKSREAGRNRGYGYSESAAIAGLRAYLGAQGTFQRLDRYAKGKLLYANPLDGKGFPDLFRVGGPLEEPDGSELKLIDITFARATSPKAAKCGYWFIEIMADKKTGPHDFTKECGLCAMPVIHGETGIHTFIINAEGTVYKKDTVGESVTVWPDVDSEGWVPVGQ